MFKKTIEYKNFLGNKVKRDFYFHISKSEFLEMGVGPTLERFNKIIESQNNVEIMHEYRSLIKLAVGVRSEDGERFLKDPESQSIFLDSPAFDELLFEICTDADKAAEFANALFPQEMQEELLAKFKDKIAEKNKENAIEQNPEKPFDPLTVELSDERPAWEREHRLATQAEMVAMTTEEFQTYQLRRLGQ